MKDPRSSGVGTRPAAGRATEADLDALLQALRAARRGDAGHRLPTGGDDPRMAEIAVAFNALVDEVVRPVAEVNRVINAVADGDLSQKVALDATSTGGELLRLGESVNAMVDRLRGVADEVTRVVREVGDEGRLGGCAEVPGMRGAWRELADGVNRLVAVVTGQLRDMAAVSLAVARGDLSERITVDAKGEMLDLKDTINRMVDELKSFGAKVSRVTKELDAAGGLAGEPGLSGMSGVWKDLTDNVSMAEQVALVAKYKSEFLANMSHELRTPLNSLLILARLLADNKEANLTPRQVEYARTIYAAGSDLLALINEILDLSKIEAGRMKVELHDVEMDEVGDFVERNFRPVAEQKNLTFTVEFAPDVPRSIHTDARRLQQVLQNLLANALKFTERGGVALRVSLADAPGRAGPAVAFAVRDTGIGIDADKQELIFEAFQQADGSTSRKYGGTGLGLSISRGFAKLLGGELRVESAPGEGSTFTLLLPLRHAGAHDPESSGERALARPGPARASPPRAEWIAPHKGASAGAHEGEAHGASDVTLAGRKVLVVDDDMRNIFALASVLESQGMHVLFAEGGRQGVELLGRNPDVDVVLMDVMMPDLDGCAAMRAIRSDPKHASLPIIAVTAGALPDDRERCVAAGASAYLPKPVDTRALLALIRRSIAR